MTSGWTEKYIGLPFVEGGRTLAGCDCGGLVLLVLLVERGIRAADFHAYSRLNFRGKGFAALADGMESLAAREWHVVTEPRPLDAVRFRYGRYPCHVGIYVDQGMFLHVEESQGAVARLTDLNDLVWRPSFVDFLRHREMEA